MESVPFKKPVIISISGHARNGKDTVAGFIKSHEKDDSRIKIMHYADLLKYICKTFLDWNGEKDEYGRTMLQHVGTNVIRGTYEDYWVGFLSDMIYFFGGNWDYVVIPDTRFPNEITYLKTDYDVIHLRIDRPNFESSLTEDQKNHSSETALDGIAPDYIIENGGSLNDLELKVDEFMRKIEEGELK